MATKAGKASVPAVRKGTEVVNYSELMAKQVAEIQSKLGAPGGDRITVSQDKKFKFPDGHVSGDSFPAVIVDFASYNGFWEGEFDRKNPGPPDCFALGTDPKDMWPSNNSPKMQSKDGCNKCPNNQFGSDGDGKACKNMRIMAVLPPDADKETPFSVVIASPTAIRPFDGYIAKLAGTFGKPPAAFVTEIGFDQKLDYASLRFGNPVPVDEDKLGIFLSRQAEAIKRLLTEPDLSTYEARKAAKPARGQAKPARR
jgi:hypothetical protein